MRKVALGIFAVMLAFLVGAFFFSCAGVQNGGGSDSTLNALADAVGFSLGVYCHDHPDVKATVESIYWFASSGQITPMTALNEGAKYLLDTDDMTRKLIVHEAFSLIRAAGGEILNQSVVNWGEADKALFEVGKAAYMDAVEGAQI